MRRSTHARARRLAPTPRAPDGRLGRAPLDLLRPSPRRAVGAGAALIRGVAAPRDAELGGSSADDEKTRVVDDDRRAATGLLARYSRWSHDRPCAVFSAIALVVLAITVVVAAADLARFHADESDKARPLDAPHCGHRERQRARESPPQASARVRHAWSLPRKPIVADDETRRHARRRPVNGNFPRGGAFVLSFLGVPKNISPSRPPTLPRPSSLPRGRTRC